MDSGLAMCYKLEEMLRIQFPRTDIKANPHIISKLTSWKKNYGTLAYILSRSGVGFNVHGDFTVDCDDKLWEHICNTDSNAKKHQGQDMAVLRSLDSSIWQRPSNRSPCRGCC